MIHAERPVLIVRHVPWEGPHRIARAFSGSPVRIVDVLERGATLPGVDEVSGAVLMGGPMSVNDTDRHPQLAEELEWLERALAADLPLLGVCLGSQLIAHALGARVGPAAAKELGWGPVDILDADDPLLGSLAPRRSVLHWHGEEFDPPSGATTLARSDRTACQAFRVGRAWGLLFHAEADLELVDRWLAEPGMAAEAREVLGRDADRILRAGANEAREGLLEASDAMFATFADLAK